MPDRLTPLRFTVRADSTSASSVSNDTLIRINHRVSERGIQRIPISWITRSNSRSKTRGRYEFGKAFKDRIYLNNIGRKSNHVHLSSPAIDIVSTVSSPTCCTIVPRHIAQLISRAARDTFPWLGCITRVGGQRLLTLTTSGMSLL